MPSITYNITVSPQNTIFKGGNTFSATLRRNETPPSGAVPVSATITFAKIRVWSSKYPYIKFGDYFTTDGLTQNSSGESLQVKVSSLDDNILNVTSTSITAEVKGSSTVNAFDFDSSSAVLTVEYEETYTNSTVTLTNSTVNAGSAVRVNFTNSNIASIRHSVEWTFGSHTYSTTTNYGATYATYTIPLSWLDIIPNAESGTGTVHVTATSSDGTVLGNYTLEFKLTVPSTVVPTLTSQTATRINNSVPSSWAQYIQNRSGVTQTANGATGIYGSTITKYTFGGATTATQASNVLTISPITQSGTLTFTVYATDSRGRQSATKQVSISVTAYQMPTITKATAFRCLSTGTSDENGTYISVKAEATYDTLSGKNAATLSCSYQRHGASTWTQGRSSMTSGSTYVIGSGGIDTNYTYRVKFTLTDSFATVERIVDVSTAQYTMFFKKGGTGVGIGKVCENEMSVEINGDWELKHGAHNLRPVVFQESEPSNPVDGQVWLVPTGSTSGGGSGSTGSSGGTISNSAVVNLIYPVGSIYMSVNSTSPSTLFGGTWEQLQNRFLLGAGSSYTAGGTGGNATSSLTVNGVAQIFPDGEWLEMNTKTTSSWSANYYLGEEGRGGSGTDSGYSYTKGVNVTGTASGSTLPPYLVVYMWKRTA